MSDEIMQNFMNKYLLSSPPSQEEIHLTSEPANEFLIKNTNLIFRELQV